MNIALRATLEPQRRAVYWRGAWLSYADLHQSIEAFAASLRDLGLRAGDRVSVLAQNHPVHLYSLYAALRHGFIHAPLNYRLPAQEIAKHLSYLGSSVLVYAPEFEAQASEAAAQNPRLQLRPLSEAPVTSSPHPLAAPRITGSDADTVMLLFTGGTTGVTKAARISRRMFETNVLDSVLAWGLEPNDSVIIATPMFHAGVNALCTPILELGGRVALLEHFTPEEFLGLAAASHSTILFAVPTMFQMLTTSAAFAEFDFSLVKYAIAGGSPCPEPVREAFAARGVRFKLGYGMTEVGVNCFAQSLEGATAKPSSVGYPMPHLRAVIRGPDNLEVKTGEVGELTLSGPQVMSGYWEKPAETAEALRQIDGQTWLFTGDLATRDQSGCHSIVGRRKEMFISGGENVFPLEIERALYEHPAVLECAVIGVPNERWGEVGLACVVCKPDEPLTPEALRDYLKSALAGYKVPKHYALLPALPKSAAGKVLKNELRQQWLEGGQHVISV